MENRRLPENHELWSLVKAGKYAEIESEMPNYNTDKVKSLCYVIEKLGEISEGNPSK